MRSATMVTVPEPGWSDTASGDLVDHPMKDVTPPRTVRALPRE